jgi:TonB family protein
MLRAVERVIHEDPLGQLISVKELADADFIVAFINRSGNDPADASSVLPDPNQIAADHRSQMIVYTKKRDGRLQLLWMDQKGGNRPEKAMFEFLRTLGQEKEHAIQQPIQQLIVRIASTESGVQSWSERFKPVILNRERAKYVEEARAKGISGRVTLSVIYNSDGELSDLLVIRGLSYGLTARCIEAIKKFRFTPATKDGQPITVRGWVDFSFAIY